MAGFVKLDTGVLNSSIWIERDLRSVFITALVMAEPFELREREPQLEVHSLQPTGWMVPPGWYGFVPAAGTGIVRRDGLEDVEAGLALLVKLCAPDLDSRSQNYDGRRMARINHGYLILNYFEYRDRDYTAAERMRRLRARRKALKAAVTRNSVDVTRDVTATEVRGQSTEVREQSTKAKKATTTTSPPKDAGGTRAFALAPYIDAFLEFFPGATISGGRWGKVFKQLERKHSSPDEVLRRWRNCLSAKGTFATPEELGTHWPVYDLAAKTNGTKPMSKQEIGRQNLEAAMARRANTEISNGN